MKQTKPFLTLFLLFCCLFVTYGIGALDTSLYGVQGSALGWLSFSPESFKNLISLSLIVSPFLHLNTGHLLMNFFLFIPISMVIERSYGPKILSLLFIMIHVQSLLLLIVSNHWINLEGKFFLGLSHVVLGLYGYFALSKKNLFLTFFALSIIAIGKWQGQDNLTLLAHVIGYLVGVELFVIRRSWEKFRSQRSNASVIISNDP
ncbi:MAG: hypothetical protein COW00_10470 [Bdellovibrio sp. CG12_big_fil_rev_8_21_14_0_65_39_13]|nr:MAG: hypothetical protein COW78_00845 [Bdellovibrio sp. CG22_combo_CG10-13_8_21_14_all_39_27]PIQ59534.1 MAG: hypothetical protein COW00_10470 [Bdellovibrio sp. CG12_big_fil_rev_8_21_14_0_65_39_13]PIR33461.1 MAG: hypothetical protein COV37_16015 [Bdellovibrio sp. CG11_big_fil_rev_8_21_14_0_20_39_38]PJB52522.1 MAG: hypothetical protein CO099_12145 [Bdellovibrio sp. CG_4_9_14_3_um_filter_39_7]